MSFTVTNRIVSFLVIFTIFLTGFVSGLSIVTEPQSFNKLTDNQLNVTCRADGPTYWARTVMIIQILKHGLDKPIASIEKHEATMGSSSDDNMMAEGHIDRSDARKSFLTLVIQKPRLENAGVYKCQMYFLDENLQLKTDSVLTNITFQDADIADTVTNLVEKFSNLLKTVQEQEDANLKQKNIIQILENKLVSLNGDHSKYGQHLDILEDVTNTQNDTIVKLNQKVDELNEDHSKHFDILTDVIKKQNETILRLNQKFDELKDDYSKHLDIYTNETGRQMDTVAVLKEFISKQQHESSERLDELERWKNKTACPDGWKHYKADQTCLKFFDKYDRGTFLSWNESREACQVSGGDLAQIQDAEKSRFVSKMTDGRLFTSAWIGVRNYARVGFDFRYLDGSPIGVYHPWYVGYPSGSADDDIKCVLMDIRKGKLENWFDINCLNRKPYVCSKPSHRIDVF